MRGRSICSPDWLSIAAPGLTSMTASLSSPTARLQASTLLARPGLHLGMGALCELLHRRGIHSRCRELESDAVRIEEVDRFDDVVIGYANHLDAGRFEACLGCAQLRDRVDTQGDVIDPAGRVGRRL